MGVAIDHFFATVSNPLRGCSRVADSLGLPRNGLVESVFARRDLLALGELVYRAGTKLLSRF
jgi:hypothetical protein